MLKKGLITTHRGVRLLSRSLNKDANFSNKNKKLRDILDEGDPVFDHVRENVTVGINIDNDNIMMDVEEQGNTGRPPMPPQISDNH